MRWIMPEILETFADIVETLEFESDVEEPATMTTVKSKHNVLDYVATLKQFSVYQSFSGDVILAISNVESFLEKEVI